MIYSWKGSDNPGLPAGNLTETHTDLLDTDANISSIMDTPSQSAGDKDVHAPHANHRARAGHTANTEQSPV
jgi:hypothetical protein